MVRRIPELAWAAGFFDGEGHASGGPTSGGSRGIRVKVAQVEIEPLQRFRDAVGIGRIYGPYDRGDKPIHVWAVTSHRDAVQVAFALWPHLSGPKKRAFKSALRGWCNAAPQCRR